MSTLGVTGVSAANVGRANSDEAGIGRVGGNGFRGVGGVGAVARCHWCWRRACASSSRLFGDNTVHVGAVIIVRG